MPGRPTIWMIIGQGPIALAVGAGGVCLYILLSAIFSSLSPLWEAARYRPLYPEQPTIKIGLCLWFLPVKQYNYTKSRQQMILSHG